MTANVNVTKVLFKRGNTAQNAAYTGINGEITVDTQAKTLRIHDGITAGGNVITAGGAVGSYSNTNAAAYIPTDPTITSIQANVAAANAAISAIAGIDTSLIANAATQQTQINSLDANVTAANAAITSLQSNAGVQATSINSINANIGEYQTFANSNAATRATSIDNINANLGSFQIYANATFGTSNYGNSNVAAYLGAFNGNILPAANVTYSLGSEQFQWRDLWVSNNTIYIGNTPIRVDGGTLLVDGAPVSLGFDQDLNTTDDVAFANIATTTGQLSVPTDTSFALRLNHSTFGEASVIVTSQGYMSITGGYTGTAFTQTLSDGEQIGSFGYSGNISDIYGKNGLTISTVGEGGPQWTFDTNGDLSVPNYISFEGNTYIGDEPGGGNPMFRIVTPLGYGATIETDSDLSGNSWTWSFGVDGTLGSPGDITAVNFIGDGSQLTGLPDGTAITNGTSTIDIPVAGGNIYVGVDNVGSTEFTINGINTLNLVSLGNVSATKFTYANGVNILDGISGNVTGNISVGDSRINFVASSSGDGNGFSTIEIRPDDVYTSNENYLIIDPTAPNHIHIRAGGEQDNSNAELYLGGENSYFMVNNGLDPEVRIAANTYVWYYGTDGNVTFPSGGSIIFDSSATSVIDGMTSIAFADATVQTTAWTGSVNFGNTIAIGYNTGTISQGGGAVAVGSTAGNVSQGVGAVAIGEAAGTSSQGTEGIAIGKTAGEQSQGAYSIAIGSAAAYYQQRTGAVAIGTSAGALQQGTHAIAIGTGAGSALQGNNSIILNATGSALEQTTDNTFTVKPIRNASGSNILYYDASTGEITYDTASGGTYGNTEVGAYLLTGINSNLGNLVVTNFSTANARITGGSITGITGAATTFVATNFSSSNIRVSGGYISALTNAYVTTSAITNFSTANALITGGSITGITGAATTFVATNFSSSNVAITGGYLDALANVTTTGNVIAANLIGYGSNTTITAGEYTSIFDTAGMVTLPSITATGNLTVAGNVTQQSAYYETYANVANVDGNLTCNFVDGATFYASLTANVTANFVNISSTTGTIVGATVIVDQGATPYQISNVQINGGGVQTVRWAGGTGQNPGTGSNTDVMSFSLINLGGDTWRVLGQISNYG